MRYDYASTTSGEAKTLANDINVFIRKRRLCTANSPANGAQ